MALIDYGGFGDGLVGGFGGDVSILNTDTRTGGFKARVSANSNGGFTKTISADGESLIVGLAIRVPTSPIGANDEFIRIRQGSALNYLTIGITEPGALEVGLDNSFAGAPSTPLASTDSGVITAETWHYLEVEWLSDPSAGSIKLRVDGNTPAGWTDLTGDTERASSSETSYELRVTTPPGGTYDVADWYAADTSGAAPYNTFLGPIKVPYSPVDSSVSSDWVGSDSNSVDNHLLLDEEPASLADYVESSTVTDRDVYGHAGVGLTGTPLAARILALAVDSDGGSQNVEYGIVSGAAETVETLATPSADGQIRTTPITTDPDGGGALTTANLDAMNLAIEVVA